MPQEPPKDRRSGPRTGRDAGAEGLWVYGLNPVMECLRAHPGTIREILCGRDDPRSRAVLALAQEHGIPMVPVDRRSLSERFGHERHQGIAARLGTFRYEALEPLLARPAPEGLPILLLDCLQDPQNLGAILRTACFLGTRAVVLPKDRSVQVTGAVFKASAGALAHLPVVQVTNLVRAMERIKDHGYWIVGLDLEGAQSLYELSYTMPVALVVGSEAAGLRPLVKRHCDFLVKIPGTGPIQSLNAAAAAAVALAEIRRQQAAAFPRPPKDHHG